MFLIFSLSNQPADLSSDNSERLIVKTVETIKHTKLNEEEKEKVLDKYTVIVRKGAHFFLYFILGILVFRLLNKLYGLKPVTFIYTIIFCFIYACSDEIHQLFVPGRSGELIDVLIDTLGSLLSTTIIYIHKKKKSN
jgi:VanZ family protein